MEEGVLQYIAPWTRGKGVVVSNGEFPKSDNYDVIELHDQGNPGHNGDVKYPWVLGTMFEQAHESLATTIRWLIEHVEEDGVLMIHLEYPKHRPSQVLDLVKMLVENPWIITSELYESNTLLILRPRFLLPDSAVSFYIDNRYEIGDTLSLIPLVHRLQDQWPNCKITVHADPYKLLPKSVMVSPQLKSWTDGVLRQRTHKTEYGDYYRRADDFYFFPIRLAMLNGYLLPGEDEKPPVPKITGTLTSKVKDRLFKRGNHDFVVVAPEASTPLRQWPMSRWKHVINWLLQNGERVVLVGKKKLEHDAGLWCNKLVNLGGMTEVRELSEIISRAKLVIGVDSSPGHLAMGHGVRSVLLQGMTAGAPLWRYEMVRPVTRKSGCLNCYQKHEPGNVYIEGKQPMIYGCGPKHSDVLDLHAECMLEISVMSVLDSIAAELDMPIQKPSLSVCMMVKNEEIVIEEAIKGAVAAADEVIVLDTGCTDKTIEIVKKYEKVVVVKHDGSGFEGGKICDYALVRNAAFNRATSKYLMWLDAGDRIEKPELLRQEVLAEKSDMLHMSTVFGDAIYLRERVGPKGLVRFADRVHETMVIDGLLGRQIDCAIQHVATKKIGREESLARNIRLLKRMIKENPKSNRRFRWFYYVARDLKQSGNQQESLAYFYQCRDGNGFWEERAHSAVEIGRAYMELKDYNNSMMAGFEALKICDGWRDPYYIIGDAYYWLGEYAKAIPWFQHSLMVPKPQTVLWLWEDLYTWLPQCQLSYCFENVNDIPNALRWSKEELKGVPPSQQSRVIKRIATLGGAV